MTEFALHIPHAELELLIGQYLPRCQLVGRYLGKVGVILGAFGIVKFQIQNI